ncbi:MAG TPA: hypothetical protein VFV78_01335 [Vicinamibacterales bacterium]|nr:hypothetical protein [Vicinamibacterales bacterium]
MPDAPGFRRFLAPAIAISLLLAGLALYLLRLDNVAGLIGDDAWYVVLAKGIAQGSGPSVISSAGSQFLSQVYPPGFPAILSLVVLVTPDFPANIPFLKSVSIVAMLASGLLTYRYALRVRGLSRTLATLIAVATVITPALVFLTTSTLMSEAVFLFVELAAVLAIERAASAADDRTGRRFGWLAGALAASAFLIRTAGLTIGVAALLYFGWKRRRATAVAFAAVAVMLVLPWMVYARMHAPTRAELVDHGGLMSMKYTDQFWTSEAGTVTSRPKTAKDLPARIERNTVNIAIRDMGGVFVPLLFRTSGESGLEVIGLGPPEDGRVPSMGSALGTKIISLGLTALAVLGCVVTLRRGMTVTEPMIVLALAMIIAWPFWTFRFVLPLVPFLLCYFVAGLDAITDAVRRAQWRLVPAPAAAARMFLCVVVGLNVVDHAQYIAQAYGDPRGVSWKAHADDIDNVFTWIREKGTREGVVAADNPALVFLRTGRKTIASDSLDNRWARWQRMGVRYVVSISDGSLMVDPRATLRYRLGDQNIWAYELNLEPEAISTTQNLDRGVVSKTR